MPSRFHFLVIQPFFILSVTYSHMNQSPSLTSTIKAYLALFVIIGFFSGLFPWIHESLRVFDYTYLMGSYGKIGAAGTDTFLGHGGTALRHGFLFAFSMIPTVMFAMGVVAAADYYGASRAAQGLFTPLMRPLMGLPGRCGLAFVSSLNSTDAGAALTRELSDKGQISNRERFVFATFQFAAASAITNYMVGAPILAGAFTTSFLLPLGVILVMKLVIANIARLLTAVYPSLVDTTASESALAAQAAKHEKPQPKSGYKALMSGMETGWAISIKLMLPNLMLAFVVIAILRETGLLNTIGIICAPLMELTGIPGIAMAALVTACTSGIAGFSVAASLYAQGLLSAQDVTILTPALFLVTSQIQYMPRLLGVIGTPARECKVMFAIILVAAFASMLLMRVII